MPDVKPISGESSVIDRMEEDLPRALERRARGEKVRFGMVVDLKKCTGCRACTLACKAENMTPAEVSYNVVLKEEIGTFPNVKCVFMYKPCFHCENPPCVPVCPVKATWKREEDGIASDPEDGPLDGSQLSWFSDRQGALGTGNQVDATGLEPGWHTFPLTAKDSSGAKGSASARILVGAQTYLPIIHR